MNAWAGSFSDWQADIASKSGVIEVLTAVNFRHPGYLRSQIRYKANVFHLFKDATSLINRLGELASRVNDVTESTIIGLSWSDESQKKDYNRVAVEAAKAELLTRLSQLETLYPNLKLDNLENDLKKIAHPRLLMEVSALLYTADGRPVMPLVSKPFAGAKEALVEMPPGQIEILYSDLFRIHLEPLMKFAVNSKLIENVEKEFVSGTILSKLTKVESKGAEKSSQIYLEEVPKNIALLRGGIGFDCSMLSVPFYVLLDSVHVYWIRKSKNPKDHPRGYILLAEIELNGKIVPYVITINGETLSTLDGRAALLAAIAKYRSKEVLVHSPAATGVVNRSDMEASLFQHEARGTPIRVQMPKGWDLIDEVTQYQYAKYYHAERLAPALLVALNEAELKAMQDVQPTNRVGYYSKPDVSQIKTIDRALIYHDVDRHAEDWAELDVTAEQVDLAGLIKEISMLTVSGFSPLPAEKTLTKDQFQSIEKEFGLRPIDVFKYWNYLLSAQQLISMSENDRRELFSPAELKSLVLDLRSRLLKEIEISENVDETHIVLLFNLPSTDSNDSFHEDLAFGYGRGSSDMRSIVGGRLGRWPELLNQLAANYNLNQPLWMRMWAVEAWYTAGLVRMKISKWTIYWRQFLHFIRDPHPKVRAMALNYVGQAAPKSPFFWTAMSLIAKDPDPAVRASFARVWRSPHLREYPIRIWPLVEELLSDTSIDSRKLALGGLANQKFWPVEVWRHLPSLLNDEKTRRPAILAIANRERWPQEVWISVIDILQRAAMTEDFLDDLNFALSRQKKWPREMVSLVEDFIHNHRPTVSRMNSGYGFNYIIASRVANAVNMDHFPNLSSYNCEALLSGKRPSGFIRLLDRVFN